MQFIWRLNDQRGVTIIIVAISIVMLLTFVALAVDIGHVMVTRNELQNVSDSSALAAARYIGRTLEGKSYQEQQIFVFNRSDIVSVAQTMGLKNSAGGMSSIAINDADVIIGKWCTDDRVTRGLCTTPKTLYDIGNMNHPDAVNVTSRRDASANGPITTFFANVFGTATVDVFKPATAALGGQCTIPPAGIPIPLGISEIKAVTPGICGARITLNPTKDSCAAWHTFTDSSHSSDQLDSVINDLVPPADRPTYFPRPNDKKYYNDPLFRSPATNAYQTSFNFTGGDLAGNFDDFESLYNYMRTRDDDGDDTVWTATIVIYQDPGLSCSNVSGDTLIVGFATMKISEVVGPTGGKTVTGEIVCGPVEPGRGGCGASTTLGSIPGLVQ